MKRSKNDLKRNKVNMNKWLKKRQKRERKAEIRGWIADALKLSVSTKVYYIDVPKMSNVEINELFKKLSCNLKRNSANKSND